MERNEKLIAAWIAKYGENFAVGPCETEEIYEKVRVIAHMAGLRWRTGHSFLERANWTYKKSDTHLWILDGRVSNKKYIEEEEPVPVICPDQFIGDNEYGVFGGRSPELPATQSDYWDRVERISVEMFKTIIATNTYGLKAKYAVELAEELVQEIDKRKNQAKT